jgi:hypothetical protein
MGTISSRAVERRHVWRRDSRHSHDFERWISGRGCSIRRLSYGEPFGSDAIGAGIEKARTVFEADYLKDHITLGYATTVHSAQGVTADSSYAILGEGASRAMASVAMTRGRYNNEAFLYEQFSSEADHEHVKPVAAPAIHDLRRRN